MKMIVEYVGDVCSQQCRFFDGGVSICSRYDVKIYYDLDEPIRCDECEDEFPEKISLPVRGWGHPEKHKKEPLKLRVRPESRRAHIIKSALVVARRGYAKMLRADIAKYAKVSEALISHYFTMAELRVEVMRYAIFSRDYRIVAEGVVSGDDIAVTAPEDVKKIALDKFRESL